MKVDTQSTSMTEGRGLLTETEREAIAGERSDSYRYKTRAYLRNRLEEVEKDVDVLEEHAPELLEDLREAVCETGSREPRERRETSADPPAGPSPTETSAADEAVETERSAPATIGEIVATVDVPGSGEKEKLRREALQAALEYLREHGEATRSDFWEDVYPAHIAQFGSKDSWWTNFMVKSLGKAADQDDRIERPGDSRSPWAWRD